MVDIATIYHYHRKAFIPQGNSTVVCCPLLMPPTSSWGNCCENRHIFSIIPANKFNLKCHA